MSTVGRYHGANPRSGKFSSGANVAGLVVIPAIDRSIVITPHGFDPHRNVFLTVHRYPHRPSKRKLICARGDHRSRIGSEVMETSVDPEGRAIPVKLKRTSDFRYSAQLNGLREGGNGQQDTPGTLSQRADAREIGPRYYLSIDFAITFQNTILLIQETPQAGRQAGNSIGTLFTRLPSDDGLAYSLELNVHRQNCRDTTLRALSPQQPVLTHGRARGQSIAPGC